MIIFLTLLSGIAWMIVYEECIRVGFKQKTYCMPLFALGLNLAWEAIHSIMGFINLDYDMVQTVVNAIWCVFDIVILYTYFKYGKEEFGDHSVTEFYGWSILVIIACFLVQWGFVIDFGRIPAMQYCAYIQNLIMSVMFIGMLEKRKSSKGQTMLLAVSKWIGTLAPLGLVCMGYGTDRIQPAIIMMGILCSVFDLLYISLLANQIKKEKAFVSNCYLNIPGIWQSTLPGSDFLLKQRKRKCKRADQMAGRAHLSADTISSRNGRSPAGYGKQQKDR